MIRFFSLLLFLIIAIPSAARCDSPRVVSGTVRRVVDGDTMILRDKRIRLFGVDAPELPTAEGVRSAAALKKLAEGRAAVCVEIHTDAYERMVAVCRSGGRDLGEWLLSHGYVREIPHFSHGFYSPVK